MGSCAVRTLRGALELAREPRYKRLSPPTQNHTVQKFSIRIEGGSRPFECGRDETVLYAMRMEDIRDIEFKCRAGGCGTCRAQVLQGHYATGAMSSEQIDERDLERSIVLACQLYPRSDLVVRAYRRSVEGITDQINATRVESRAQNEGRHMPTAAPQEDIDLP